MLLESSARQIGVTEGGEAFAQGVERGLRSTRELQLAQDGAHMAADGSFADHEGVGDLLITHPSSQEPKDLELAF